MNNFPKSKECKTVLKRIISFILVLSFLFPLPQLYAQGTEKNKDLPKLDFPTFVNPQSTIPNDTHLRQIAEYKIAEMNDTLKFRQAVDNILQSDDADLYEKNLEVVRHTAVYGLTHDDRIEAIYILGTLCINGEQVEKDIKAISQVVLNDSKQKNFGDTLYLAITYFPVCSKTKETEGMIFKFISDGIIIGGSDEKHLSVATAAIRGLGLSSTETSLNLLRQLADLSIKSKSFISRTRDDLLDTENIEKIQGALIEQLAYREDYHSLSNYINHKFSDSKQISGVKDALSKIYSSLILGSIDCSYKKAGNSISPKDSLMDIASNGLLEPETRDAARDVLLNMSQQGSCACLTKYYIGGPKGNYKTINCGYREVSDYIDAAKYKKMIDNHVSNAFVFIVSWYAIGFGFWIVGKVLQFLPTLLKMVAKINPSVGKVTDKIVLARKARQAKKAKELAEQQAKASVEAAKDAKWIEEAKKGLHNNTKSGKRIYDEHKKAEGVNLAKGRDGLNASQKLRDAGDDAIAFYPKVGQQSGVTPTPYTPKKDVPKRTVKERYFTNPYVAKRAKATNSFKYNSVTEKAIQKQVRKVTDWSEGSRVYLTTKQAKYIAKHSAGWNNLLKNMARCRRYQYPTGRSVLSLGGAEIVSRVIGTGLGYTWGKNKDSEYVVENLYSDVPSTLIKGPVGTWLFDKSLEQAAPVKEWIPKLLASFKLGFAGGAFGELAGATIYYSTGGAEKEYPEKELAATGWRAGYGVAWTIPSTILKLSIYEFIMGLRCVLPHMPLMMKKSPGAIETIQFTIASVTLLGYSLGTSVLFFALRGEVMQLLGYYTEGEKKAMEKDFVRVSEDDVVLEEGDSLVIVTTQEDGSSLVTVIEQKETELTELEKQDSTDTD